MKKPIVILLCMLLLLPTAACGGKTPAPTPTAAPAPTAAPTPTAAPAPSPTPAATPEPTPSSPASPGSLETPQPATPPSLETPAPTEAPSPPPGPSGGSSASKGDATADDAPSGPAWLTLPEGSRWLTHRELAEWGAWFSMDPMRDQFLYSTYARPGDADLGQIFYNGCGQAVPPTDLTDVRAFLMEYGSWNTWTDADKLPAEILDDVLKDYLGVPLSEMSGVGLYMLSYVPETDCYYHFHGDTNRRPDPIFLYGWEKDEEVSLFYDGFAFGHERNLDGVFRVTLRLTPGDWRFTANEYCQVENGRLTYVAEPDDWMPESGEKNVGMDVPQADENLSMRGLEAALDAVRSRFAGKEEVGLASCYTAGDAEPLYCFIIGTTPEGKTEACFVGGDGSVLPMPVPEDVPADEVYYEAESALLCQFSCGRETEDGYAGRSWSFLVPTGELFWYDYSW